MTRSLDSVLERLRARLSDEAVAALVQEAQAEALAEVRGLLKDLFVQEMLAHAARLDAALPPLDAVAPPLDAVALPLGAVTPPLGAVAVPHAPAAGAWPEAPPLPEPRADPPELSATPLPRGDAEGFYLYGIVAAPVGLALPELVGVGQAAVWALTEGSLAAVVSRAPFAAFDRDALTAHLDDPAWLDAYPYAHQRVQDAVLGHGALVPVRFGTLFHTPEAVCAYLDAHEAVLTESLARLGGRAEWTLKVWSDREVLGAWIAHQRDEAAPDANGTGTAYLHRKQLGRVLHDEVRGIEAECAAALHASLAALAADAHSRPVHAREGSGPRLVAQQSYLVDEAARAAFEAEVESAATRFAAWGITAEGTGPWPAYSFVGLPGEG